MEKYLQSFLSCVVVPDPTDDQMKIILQCAKKADHEHLSKGDVILPLKARPLQALMYMDSSKTLLGKLIENPTEENVAAVTEALKSCIYPPTRVFVQNHILRLCLTRENIIKEVLCRADSDGLNYGSSNILADKCVVIYHEHGNECTTSDVLSVRSLLLYKHMRVLAHMAGAAVQEQKVQKKHKAQHIEAEEAPENSNCRQKIHNNPTAVDNDMPNIASSLVEQQNKSTLENPPSYMQSSTNSFSDQFSLNNSGLDRATQNIIPHMKLSASEVINVSISRDVQGSFHCEGHNINYGPVLNINNNKPVNLTRQQYTNILRNELRQAAAAKQEISDQNKGWEEYLQSQAEACMILHFLSVSPNTQIKVEVEASNSQNTREWAFILYNYARLCVLFDSFHGKVANGDMPSLPDISEVKLSLLSTDDEWSLIWVFIIEWPRLVENFAQDMIKTDKRLPKLSAVVRFLSSLSHCLSVYYSRYHILPQTPQNHLLPQMYARLHLLKIVQRLMEICFHTLGVTPPRVM